MPTSITCESCGQRLLIGWAPNYELTCPHCMATFRNPNYGQSPPAPEATAMTTVPSDIDDRLNRLIRPRRHETPVAVADIDTDVRRDLRISHVLVGMLVVAGILGVILFGSQTGPIAFMGVLFVGSAIFSLVVVGIIGLSRWATKSIIGSVIRWLVVAVFIVIATYLAFMIFAMAACAMFFVGVTGGRH